MHPSETLTIRDLYDLWGRPNAPTLPPFGLVHQNKMRRVCGIKRVFGGYELVLAGIATVVPLDGGRLLTCMIREREPMESEL